MNGTHENAPPLLLSLKENRKDSTIIIVGDDPSQLNALVECIDATQDHLKDFRKSHLIEDLLGCQYRRVCDNIAISESSSSWLLLQRLQVTVQFQELNVVNKDGSEVCNVFTGFFTRQTSVRSIPGPSTFTSLHVTEKSSVISYTAGWHPHIVVPT